MSRAMTRWFAVLVLAGVVLALDAASAVAEHRRYAVIVASSEDPERKLPPLQYADDDGARYHELFTYVADTTLLYTVLDAESQRTFPAAARVARLPRRHDVLAGLDATFAAIDADIGAGHEVSFYFVLIGHGKIADGGEGYVALLDGAFSRTDLFQRVLARSRATTNHIVVDACNAYFLVHRRGGGVVDDTAPPQDAAMKRFLAKEDLAAYPNTGVLLATSTEQATHEWSVYRGGVFSHQLRSALVGGADVNRDGEVAYSEVEAFIAAANQHVIHPEARVQVFMHAPAIDQRRPFVDLQAARFSHWLTVPAGEPLRVYVEDARGVRYLDVHIGERSPVVFALVPSSHYYVRSADGAREVRVALGKTPRVKVERKALRKAKSAARGAIEESFRAHLFEEPFGLDFYRGYAAAESKRTVDLAAAPWWPGPTDATVVDGELRRLNDAARRDPVLRARLTAAAPELMQALADGAHERARDVLRHAERR
jgi:hypothetical protein